MATPIANVAALIEKGTLPELVNGDLRVVCEVDADLPQLLQDIHPQHSVRVFRDEIEIHDFDDLRLGDSVKVHVRKVQSAQAYVGESLDGMLSYQGGQFLVKEPREWYLIDESRMRGQVPASLAVQGYARVPEFLAFLRGVLDFVAPNGVIEVFVILVSRRLDVPVRYAAADLAKMPSIDEFEEVRDDVLANPQSRAKRELLKRAIVNFLEPVPENERFGALMRGFSSVKKSYEASRDNFLSDFEFEKLSERFEQRRQEFMLKLDGLCGDLLNKVIAIPIGQAVVVSQYKTGNAGLANAALLFGSALFTVIGFAFVINQVHSIREVRDSAKREVVEVESKFPSLYARIEHTYGAVLYRLRWYARLIPALVSLLLLAGFGFSVAGFDAVEPCSGCVRSAISDLLCSIRSALYLGS